MATTKHVASASELRAALTSAKGGDTIALKSGDYGWVSLDNLKFDSPVTITSADDAGGARFRHITLKDSTHLIFDAITVEYGRVTLNNETAIDIRNSHYVKIVNSEIIGHTGTKDWLDVGRGIMVWQNSSNVEVADNHIHHFARGALFFGNNMVIKNNIIDDMRFDGLFFGKSDNVLIENNFMTDFYRQGTGRADYDHADYIQFDPGTTGAARDVVIRGNVMLKGNGNGDVQGIFGANHHMNAHNSVFENFLIEDNIYLDHGLNAIQFYSGKNMVVRNNTVLTDPADGRVVWVRLHGPQSNSVLENNVATQVNAEGGASAFGNVTVQYKDPAKPNYYGELFVNPFADPANLADLAPIADSAIGAGSGKGAAPRFQELLGGNAAEAGRAARVDTAIPADDGGEPVDDAVNEDVVVDEGAVADEGAIADEGAVADEAMVADEGAGGPALIAAPGAFTGKGSEVIVPHQSSFALADGTLELAFTPESVAARQALFSKDSLGLDDGGHLTVAIDNGAFIARLQSASGEFEVRADNAVTAGVEHHAAVKFGENGLKLYLNGVLADSDNYRGGLEGNAEPIVLGAGQTRSGDGVADPLEDFFNGAIAGVALYEEPAGGDAGSDGFLLLS
jgi:hypothetical protein